MDNVNIENVGGMRGVASEATLQSLVEAIRKTGGNAAANSVQNLHTRSIKDNTKAEKDNSVATGKTTVNLKEFGKELITGGDRVSDFADALFGSSSKIARFSGYVDGIIDDFRSLSSVGASFNNSIFDMIGSSSNAAMTMDGFSQLIRNNSTELAYFAGTVTKGAKFLGEFSRDVRLGIGSDFFAMGMTIQDINEGLVDFMSLETMRGRTGLRNDAVTQNSAANYIRQLDLLSKLTGKQKDALAQDIAAMQTDTKMRNVFNKIEQTRGKAAAQQAETIYALQANAFPTLNTAFLDMADGVAQSQEAMALEVAAPGMTAFQQRLAQGGMSMEEFNNGQRQFGIAINTYAAGLGGSLIDSMRNLGGFNGALADVADTASQYSQFGKLDPAAAAAEQKKRDRITSTLGKFEQAIIAVRKSVIDAFINSAFADKLGELGDTLLDMFGEGSSSNPFTSVGSSLKNFFDRGFGANGWFTTKLVWLADYVKSGGLGRAFNWLAEKATFIGDFFKNLYTSYSPGTLTAIGNGLKYVADWATNFLNNVKTNGLWEALQEEARDFGSMISTAFDDLMSNQQLINNIKDSFGNVFDAIKDTLKSFWTGSRGQELSTSIGFYFRELMIYIKSAINDSGFIGNAAIGNDQLIQDRENLNKDRYSAGVMTDPAERTAYERILNEKLTKMQAIVASGRGVRGAGGGISLDRATAAAEEIQSILDSHTYAKGTGGFKDFGKQSLAMLHGNEAVVPRNTPEGDMLAEFYKSQGTNGFQNFGKQPFEKLQSNTAGITKNTLTGEVLAQELSRILKMQEIPAASRTASMKSMTADNQTEMNKKLDQLNSTMQTVAALLTESVTVQRKMNRGIGGMGTDLMRG